MAKLILSLDGSVLREIPLTRQHTSIGRKPDSDIRIENLAISGEHAVIVSLPGEDLLHDLDSTNGTVVNGQTIKKHLLVDGDVISLGKYRLKYFSEATTLTRRDALRREVAGAPAAEAQAGELRGAEAPPLPLAELEVLSGSSAGRRLELTKARSVIGKPAAQAAAIDRRTDGYFLLSLAGPDAPLLNGRALGEQGESLADQDVIELAGVSMVFHRKS